MLIEESRDFIDTLLLHLDVIVLTVTIKRSRYGKSTPTLRI
ncbi:MAG: hypothetical protein QXV57_09900 [Thermoproteota archaeon]